MIHSFGYETARSSDCEVTLLVKLLFISEEKILGCIYAIYN